METLGALDADGIILAVPPAALERITGRRLPTTHAVRVACLDLGLRTFPRSAARVALGIDQPLYLSVHSTVARLAPAGAAVVHACKYLAGCSDAACDRRELEEFVELAIPDWREHAEVIRFLPDMPVTPAVCSLQGRPAIDQLGIPGVVLAGDWLICRWPTIGTEVRGPAGHAESFSRPVSSMVAMAVVRYYRHWPRSGSLGRKKHGLIFNRSREIDRRQFWEIAITSDLCPHTTSTVGARRKLVGLCVVCSMGGGLGSLYNSKKPGPFESARK